MPRFKKKPTVVDAIQACDWPIGAETWESARDNFKIVPHGVYVLTNSFGERLAKPSDYILRHRNGVFTIMNEKAFNELYEREE